MEGRWGTDRINKIFGIDRIFRIVDQHFFGGIMKYEDITRAIIACAMKVHSTLGNGFQEVIYQRCLAIELARRDISFEREVSMAIRYEGIVVGRRRMDFLVKNKIMVELKAVYELEGAHLVQGLNYLQAYHLETGLLINFGAPRLQFKRLFNKRLQAK